MSEPQIITLGCRLNAYESEVMRKYAAGSALRDVVIVNTCAVTGEAVRQAGQVIRKLRRERPGACLVVTGCAAQIDPGHFAAMEEVDHIVGNAAKLLPATYQALKTGNYERVVVDDIMSVRETASHMIDGFGTRARAYVQVQNGCDHRCTFCIIPFGRGPSRSVPAGDVVAQVRRLVAGGCKEVVLTGVDMTAYGRDLPGASSLGRLVKQVLKRVPALERLRLSSIDQVEADSELISVIAGEPRLMPHLHLSLQSGDDLILKRMKRRHSRDDAIAFCSTLRSLRPDIVFGADLIAGFPTETPEMFENTLRAVDECGLTSLHVFPFSPRKGTPAARMPQLDRGEIKSRARRLRDKGHERLALHLESQQGRVVDVLMERDGIGRTPQFTEVALKTGAAAGSVLRARIVSHDGKRLAGEAVA